MREDRSIANLSQRVQELEFLLSTTSRMEKRFQNIVCKPTIIKYLSDDMKKAKIKQWLGNSCNQIFSIGFSYYQSGDLDEKKVKSFCSQNILSHILKLSQVNQFKKQDFQFIDQYLQKELLPYFLMRYPLGEQKQKWLGFSSKVVEKNNRFDPQNDLVYASKVKFKWRQEGNYNDYIMKFLNYIIELPETKKQSKNQQTIYNLFLTKIEEIFKKVQEQKYMQTFKKTNEVSLYLSDIRSQNPSEKELQEYRDKVKSYTSFSIGRKLSKDIKKFSQDEINSCNISIKSNALMRVITKWCEQLEQCFKQSFFFERQEQFRTIDGSTRFIPREYLSILEKLLQIQKKQINKKLQKLMDHNYTNQSEYSKTENNISEFMKEEGLVGHFSSKVYRNNQSYLISHLNNLLHGILTATKHLQIVCNDAQFISNYQSISSNKLRIEDYIQGLKNQFSEQKKSHYYVPQLITFLVGDLLRCKCSSREKQIIALYNEIEKINKEKEEQDKIFKIVRVKNRLESGTKDILLNLMFNNSVVVQMQLAINSDKTKFLEHSNHFNHYIYELKRSQFGPISELSNIWINLSLCSNFYLEKLQCRSLPNKKQGGKKCYCGFSQNQPILQPFECTVCGAYYKQATYIENNIKCVKCKVQTCLKCRLGSDYKKSKQIINFLPQFEDQHQIEICTEQIPNSGLLVNLKDKKKSYHFFKIIKYRKQTYVFINSEVNKDGKTEGKKLRMLSVLKGQKELKFFMKDHFIITSQKFQAQIPNIDLSQAIINFFLPEKFLEASKTQKNCISAVNQKMNDDNFKEIIQNISLPSVQKIDFSQNDFKKCEWLFSKFQNAKYIVLDDNKIRRFGDGCQKESEIIEINIDRNRISEISENVQFLQKLTILNIEGNRLESLPKTFEKLQSLTHLNLEENFLKQLPHNFGNLRALVKLNLTKNQLKELPSTFGRLQNLSRLNVSRNELIKLPQNFGGLKNLKNFNCEKNNLKTLPPQDFRKLKKLVSFNISNNELQTFLSDQDLDEMILLRKLRIKGNKIPEKDLTRKILQILVQNQDSRITLYSSPQKRERIQRQIQTPRKGKEEND